MLRVPSGYIGRPCLSRGDISAPEAPLHRGVSIPKIPTMQLVKSSLSVNFETASEPWLQLRAMIRAITSDSSAEVQAAPFVFDKAEEKKRFVLAIRSVNLEHELPSSLQVAVADASKTISDLHSVSPFPKLSGIRHDALFIEPYSMPFHELVSLVKARYLAKTALIDSAADVGASFDIHEDGAVKHIQIGPMDQKQLQSQYLRRPAEGLPETFLFMSLGFESTSAQEYSGQSLESFFAASNRWQVGQAEAIVKELRGEP